MASLYLLVSCTFIFDFASCNEVYHGGVAPDDLKPDTSLDRDDPHCTHHIHKFYRQMACTPHSSPDSKCPTSYHCATLEGRSPDKCYYAGREYPVGANISRETVEFQTPCIQSCQCVRMVEGARFYCSKSPKKDCKSAPGCQHFSFVEDFTCCERGVTSCNHGKQDSVKCVFDGQSYNEGEKIFPHDDMTCAQCVCASGFNGTIAPPYCQPFACVLELWGDTPIMLTRGCIPVYLSEAGCCPVAYRCPKPSDDVLKSVKKTDSPPKTDKKCHFGNLTLEVGDHLSSWIGAVVPKEVECSCRVPPLASCVRRNFVLSDKMRKSFAREGLDSTQDTS